MNLFMFAPALRPSACRELPSGYRFRPLRPDELELWYAFPFDSPAEQEANRPYMRAWYERVYATREELFFERCQVIVDRSDRPLATGFLWPSLHGRLTTLHWLKVLKPHEGQGLGRALLTRLLRPIPAAAWPVYLHTQPESYRAIKLYSDFGFRLLDSPAVGQRQNDLTAALPLLEAAMTPAAFTALEISDPPPGFLDLVDGEPCDDF